uniref:SPW repeat protein n=1 Tax=Roseihalotalea indica TaxID=2867963 RepID=A0AA49JH33_9BACT|nr:SPW repeat protein [Tunicatimonas sp. TK19036]
MRPIPTKIHGVLDYISALLFILSPWIFDFANGGMAQWLPVIIGVMILIISLITDYELSVTKLVPMSTHLAFDVLGGGLLTASPWLFGFADWIFWPHLLFGIFMVGSGMLTRQVPDDRAIDMAPEEEIEEKYKAGDVIDISDRRKSADQEAQRHMAKDEELDMHEDQKEAQREQDSSDVRRNRQTEDKPYQHDQL